MCFCFLNEISMGVVYTDQELYTYYYLQIINICVLFPLGWLYMNTEALVLLITKYNVSWFQGSLCEYSLPAVEGTMEAPCWVPSHPPQGVCANSIFSYWESSQSQSERDNTEFLERIRWQQSEMEKKNMNFIE